MLPSTDELVEGTEPPAPQLRRVLTVRDLTALGIAAIVGAGIFSTIGNAAADGGPAVSLLFVFTAVACGFSALCYAEFASSVPISGSAYTYAYVSFGELLAWIIGWDLLLEYAIGNIAVAISWSDYFTAFLRGLNIHLPAYLTMDFFSAFRGYEAVQRGGEATTPLLQEAAAAWSTAPQLGSLRLIVDLPALVIVALITAVVYIGVRESKTINNVMVGIKVLVVLAVILIGAFYVHPANWNPFDPEGFGGVMKGVSAVFFAYIGFDALSTTAEEARNPRRDLPRAIIYSLIICTILYVLITLVLTGMVSYKSLRVGDPLAFVFQRVGLHWIGGIVAFTALIAMASVLLVFQMGQPRIWMNMSRDGLLPPAFSRIHPRFQTPSFATVVTGFVVAIPALFMNLTEVTDLTSIGTLFAFVLVCGGLLVQQQGQPAEPLPADGRFRVPYVNGKYWVPVLLAVMLIGSFVLSPESWTITALRHEDEWPFLLFLGVAIWVAVLAYRLNLSLIPVLGLLSCLYLMSELGATNWIRFLIWLVLGLVVYFTYSRSHSKLKE
ncbi:amino acid permease [Catalinimonas alkaloidigena]|nr:amino acid permease [Catalinimonas alkaloidigena]